MREEDWPTEGKNKGVREELEAAYKDGERLEEQERRSFLAACRWRDRTIGATTFGCLLGAAAGGVAIFRGGWIEATVFFAASLFALRGIRFYSALPVRERGE